MPVLPFGGLHVLAKPILKRYQLTLDEVRNCRQRGRNAFKVAVRREIIEAAALAGYSTVKIGRFLHRDHKTVHYHLERMGLITKAQREALLLSRRTQNRLVLQDGIYRFPLETI